MADTKIEWCDKVWNPVAGCTKCSPGCLNCYAERMAYCLCCMGREKYEKVVYQIASKGFRGDWNNEVVCDESILDQPLHWREPKRIFVCSMSDLFHEKVPFEFIAKVWDIMFECHLHIFLILTKRIKRLAEFCKWLKEEKYRVVEHYNIHLGVSISTPDEMWKAKVLSDIPAAVRFISFEPLLADINNITADHIKGVDGAIIGCESGPNRRECKNEWVTGLVEDFEFFNKPVFVKQISVDGKVVKMPKAFPQQLPERS